MNQPMRRHLRAQPARAAVVAAGVLLLASPSGCACDPELCMPTGSSATSQVFGTTGTPLRLSALLPVTCGSRSPSSVTVSVLDPRSTPSPFEASSPRATSDGFEADITFTPTQAGTYQVAARFEPNFGLTQVTALVALERRDAGSVVVPQQCVSAAITPGGLALCRTTGAVLVFDGGTQVQTLNHSIASLLGGTLWASDGLHVVRYSEDAGHLVQVAQATTATRHSAIVPSGDTAFFVSEVGGVIERWTDGGFERQRGPTVPFSQVAWFNATHIATVRGNQWCVFALDQPDAGERCQMLTMPKTVGFEPSGIWLENETMAGFEALSVDHSTIARLGLPAGWRLSSAGPGATMVRYDTGVQVVDTDGGSVGPFVLRRVEGSVQLENHGPALRFIGSTCVGISAGAGTRLVPR